MDRFRNINYPFANDDDTFIARGYNLNQIVDEINSWSVGVASTVGAAGAEDIVLGLSEDIDAAFIDYKATFPGSPGIGSNFDQVGVLEVNNSSEHASNTGLSWTRESVNHGSGTEESSVAIEFLVVGANLIMRVTNTSGYSMEFMYSIKTMNYVS